MVIPTSNELEPGEAVDIMANSNTLTTSQSKLNTHPNLISPPSPPTSPSDTMSTQQENINKMEMSLSQTTQSTPNTSLSVPNDTVQPKICEVCEEKLSKYKCPRCMLGYCSVGCSTIHKASHSPLPSPTIGQAVRSTTQAIQSSARAGTVAGAKQAGPFTPLNSSLEVPAMFRHYPNLVAHLNEIHDAMQPPRPEDTNLYEKVTGKRQPAWTPDRGLEMGRQALQAARMRWGRDGEGVREFGELVLRVVDGVDEEAVRLEADRENSRIVQALLDGEL